MALDAAQVGLCGIGAFYAFAGYVATRAALMSLFVDRAIAAIGGVKPDRTDTAQSWWLLVASVVVLAGGVTLVFLMDIAAWLFLATAIGQAAYVFYVAPRFFDSEDSLDPAGRRQTTNAFIVYLVATALVVWGLSAGKLLSWHEIGWPLIALPAALIGAHIGYVIWTVAEGPASNPAFAESPGADWDESEEPEPGPDPSQSTRIKVMADYCTDPLWALDDGVYGCFPPEALGLSPELAKDLNAWAAAFTDSLDPENPAVSLWSEAERLAHDAMARRLAIRLARERPDRIVYILDSDTGDAIEVQADEDAP